MNNLTFIRMKLRITQYRLARMSGVPRYKISLYENNLEKLTSEEIQKISQILKIDSKELNHD